MIRVALRGLAGRKLRAFLTAHRDRPRRRDGERHVRAHRRDRQRVQRTSSASRTRGRTRSSAAKSPDISVQRATRHADAVGPDSVLAAGAEAAGRRGRRRAASPIRLGRRRSSTARARPISTSGAPSFGFGVDFSEPRFNPLALTSGRWPSSSGPGRHRSSGPPTSRTSRSDETDQRRRRLGAGPAVQASSGSRSTGNVELARESATFAVFTIPTAQELFDRQGKLDAISVAAKPESRRRRSRAQIRRSSCRPRSTVRTATAQAKEDAEEVGLVHEDHHATSCSRSARSRSSSGAFVIFNTLSITVAQRIREFATLADDRSVA